MIRKFPSIARPAEYGYAYDSSKHEYDAPIDSHFRMYQTYGDGVIQHSYDWPVTWDHFADYCGSLAAAMVADEELTAHLVYTFLSCRVDPRSFEFAAGVVFKPLSADEPWERKPRYFSVSERKITSSPAREFDKRYRRVENWCDGSAAAIFRMVCPEYADGLEKYQVAAALYDWTRADDSRPWMPRPSEFLKITQNDLDKSVAIENAWNACVSLCRAYEARQTAIAAINNYRRMMEPATTETAA